MIRPRAYIAIALGIACTAPYGVLAGCIGVGAFLFLSAGADK